MKAAGPRRSLSRAGGSAPRYGSDPSGPLLLSYRFAVNWACCAIAQAHAPICGHPWPRWGGSARRPWLALWVKKCPSVAARAPIAIESCSPQPHHSQETTPGNIGGRPSSLDRDTVAVQRSLDNGRQFAYLATVSRRIGQRWGPTRAAARRTETRADPVNTNTPRSAFFIPFLFVPA